MWYDMVKMTKYLFVLSSMTYLTCGPKYKGVMITINHNDGVGQNGQISFRKNGKEHCGYMVCGSKIFFVPSEKYEPNIQPTL